MTHVEQPSGTRRDFLFVATGAAGGVATAAAVWPLINQMNPSAETSTWIEESACTSAEGFIWLISGQTAAAVAMPPAAPVATKRKSRRVPD